MKDYQVLISHTDGQRKQHQIIMTPISEKEEEALDSGKSFVVKRDCHEFFITPNDVICYGEIDFHEGSEDYETIDEFTWLWSLGMHGKDIPARYNYDEHVCISDRPMYKTYDTMSCAKYCQWKHGLLGKPKRTLIFKMIV